MADQREGLNPAGGSAVVLAEADYDNLGRAVSLAFELFPLPLKGARVLVKPNMLGPYDPALAVTTHPALVTAVVDRLLAAGARPMVGDNPGARGYGINERCGEVTGIAAAARGCFINLGLHPVEVPLGPPPAGKVMVAREVLEADLIVNLPKLKTHVLTILSGGLKNTFGYLVAAEKSRMHAAAPKLADFGRILTDIYALRPPSLTIMDAVTAMEGDGPSGGRPRFLGKVIASDDNLAVDALACRLIGLASASVVHLADALRRWPDRGRIGDVGPAAPAAVPGFALPGSFARDLKGLLANRVVFSFLKSSPLRVSDARCDGCGTCVESCPVGAMTVSGGRARIDRGKCILCYCCHELCPAGAVRLSTPVRALLGRLSRQGAGRTARPPVRGKGREGSRCNGN